MLLNPTTYGVGSAVELFHVRFDVQNRRAVQNIHLCEVESVPLDPLDLHDGKADMIRAVRTPNGEDAMFHVLKIWFGNDLLSIGQREVVKKDGMAEAIKVFQAPNVLVFQFDPRLGLVAEDALNWRAFRFFVRRMDDAYRIHGDWLIHLTCLTLYRILDPITQWEIDRDEAIGRITDEVQITGQMFRE
jgi:hypothetical protein